MHLLKVLSIPYDDLSSSFARADSMSKFGSTLCKARMRDLFELLVCSTWRESWSIEEQEADLVRNSGTVDYAVLGVVDVAIVVEDKTGFLKEFHKDLVSIYLKINYFYLKFIKYSVASNF
ncbi:hypothetical protein BpHYR1_027243 [Brachionus plicatilis]|uniref:Uncharacterized protein n=1 Tax=Brachionus plicatilis TaxID=10195 RepID=A0A3M7SNH1_BRAPC|nr:hypothetical protein BpHYR1_027243 [Brachionus plicatilis]